MKTHIKKNAFFYIAILLLLGSTAYFYFQGEYEKSQLSDQIEDQRQETKFYVSQAIDSATVAPLRLTARSLSWAIRTELLNENKEEVSRYFRELARNKSIEMAVLCDTTNRIRYAADVEHRGKFFRQYHGISHLRAETIQVKPATHQKGFFLVAPIMGLNRRYGTLFVHYR